MKSMHLVLISAMALHGCANTKSVEKVIKLVRVDLTKIQAASMKAVECQEMFIVNINTCPPPEVAVRKLSRNFKYGRFCGANFPTLRHQSNKDLEELTEAEKLELAENYYQIHSIDDLDTACREHDVCWLLNSENEQSCNDELRNRMKAMRDGFEKQVSFSDTDTDTPQFRCANLSIDISLSTHLMQSDSENSA
jgi:hypothetical protein